MALSRLGDYIEQVDNRNISENYSEKDVRGISTSKAFIDTKADLTNVSLLNYKIVNKNEFAYVADTSRRGDKIALAYADDNPCIVSSIYTVFKVKRENELLPRYLMMFFNRPEFDRYARYNSWGSAREIFSWDDFCDIKIEIPSVEIQNKYVNVYEGVLANYRSYNKGLEDLKLTCEAYIEQLKKDYPLKKLESVVEQYKQINTNLEVKKLAGLIGGEIKDARKSSGQNNLKKFQIIYPNTIVYPPPHFGEIGTIGLVENEAVLMSPMYVAFKAKEDSSVNMNYLMIWFRREEFKRYAYFMSCSSVRDTFDFELLKEYQLPIPPKEIQDNIVSVYKVLNSRKRYEEYLKEKISSICPILIRGSVLELGEGAI